MFVKSQNSKRTFYLSGVLLGRQNVEDEKNTDAIIDGLPDNFCRRTTR